MNGLLHHLILEFRTGMRNRSLLLLYYLFPLAFYIMMGLIMTELIPDFRSFMIPAMIVFAILSGQILGLPNPLVEAREAGVFRSYRINGIPEHAALGVPTIAALGHTLVASLIIALSGSLLFGAIVPTSWSALVLVTLAAATAYAGLGALIGVISASSRATVMWSQLVYMPSFLLGGVNDTLGTAAACSGPPEPAFAYRSRHVCLPGLGLWGKHRTQCISRYFHSARRRNRSLLPCCISLPLGCSPQRAAALSLPGPVGITALRRLVN